MDTLLQDKTVFVTGGSSGIGKAIVQAYSREPEVRIAFSYHTNREQAESLVSTLQNSGIQAMAVSLDLTDPTSISKAVGKIIDTWGSVDVLINNAVQWPSSQQRLPFEEVPYEEWNQVIQANVLGTVKVLQEVTPLMRQRGWGRIVNISSDLAEDSMPGSGPYSTAKSALSGLTRSLVTELSADGILSNVVLPSLTLTEKAEQRFPPSLVETFQHIFPTGRVTAPEDVASLVVYLGSGANLHVNGEAIKVTGNVSQDRLTHAHNTLAKA